MNTFGFRAGGGEGNIYLAADNDISVAPVSVSLDVDVSGDEVGVAAVVQAATLEIVRSDVGITTVVSDQLLSVSVETAETDVTEIDNCV
ncbi:MAG: hypothetical protein DRI46_06785 [Chloroflexi bacterium]|nr:MAG: hypothetical protein DRI46_06785 [Chloroflexota bacterium]